MAEERREGKYKGERERYTQLNVEFLTIIRRNKAFLNEQYKEIEVNGKAEWERIEISFKNLERSREHFMQGRA